MRLVGLLLVFQLDRSLLRRTRQVFDESWGCRFGRTLSYFQDFSHFEGDIRNHTKTSRELKQIYSAGCEGDSPFALVKTPRWICLFPTK